MTLTLACTHEGRAIPDAAFSVYRVGAVDAYGRIRRVGPFAGYPVDTEGLDQKGWNTLALTLSGYVQRDGVPALDSGRTGTDGYLRFPTASASMQPGRYLVAGEAYTADHTVYTPSPFMVFLPGSDQDSNSWRHTWSGLSGRHSWTVSERAPDGYRVKVERTGVTFVIRNTFVPPATPPTAPPKKPPQIPKTGLLWWPVPVLAVLGLLFMILGLLKRKCV